MCLGDKGHSIYNEKLRALYEEWIKGIKCGVKKVDTKCARQFMDLIKNSHDPYIRGFNKAALGGKEAVKKWFTDEGTKLLEEEKEFAEKLAKKGRKAKIAGYVKFAGKVVKVIIIAEAVYLISEHGVAYAVEQSARSLVFADGAMMCQVDY